MHVSKKSRLFWYIAGIFLAFVVWSVVSVGWYVCGVKDLCLHGQGGVAEAQSIVIYNDGTTDLVETQGPVAVGYERSGAMGEIFVMLMIAFTLGALLGRILAAPKNNGENGETNKMSVISLPGPTEKTKLSVPVVKPVSKKPPMPRQTSGPVHISQVTKHVPRPPVQAGGSPAHHAQTRSPVILSRQQTHPQHPQQPPVKNPERPKIRFNTSWNKPR
jgi:hypothetical protein